MDLADMQRNLSSQGAAIDYHEQSIQLAWASMAALDCSMNPLVQRQDQITSFGVASNSGGESAKLLRKAAAQTQAVLEDWKSSRLPRVNLDYLGFLPTPPNGSQSSAWPAPASRLRPIMALASDQDLAYVWFFRQVHVYTV